MTDVFIIKDESNDFDQFTKDKILRKYITGKLSYVGHMIIFMDETMPEDTKSYMLLKFGDTIKNLKDIIPDRSPVMFEDYWPAQENKFTKYIYENQRNPKRRQD